MNKILFVAINARYMHTNLALLYLNRMTAGFDESSIAEFNISQNAYEILARISEYQPDIVAISTYIWNSGLVRELINDLKKVLPQAKIVLGGPEVSYNAQDWLNTYPSIDFIVTVGGEKGWLKLLQDGFGSSEKIVQMTNLSLEEIPFPYSEENIKDLQQRIIYYESSRGCPYKCSYCLSSRSDNVLELRGLDKVKEELMFFIKREVPLLKFVDRTFNANVDYARHIWEFIITNQSKTCFHFEINPLLINEQDIELLKDVPENLMQFEIGVQSTNSETLKEIRRQGDWELIKDKISSLIEQTSIPIHLDLIFGLPYENYNGAQKSFNEIFDLHPNHIQPGMLKVLPGTEMAEKAGEYEMVYQNQAPYKILTNKWISFRELRNLQNFEHLVNNLYNSHRFVRTLENLIIKSKSPFDLFSELEKYWVTREVNPWQKDWIATAILLVDFVKKRYQPDLDFILDTLRYDLCSTSGLQYYPDFLQTENLKEIINNWKKYLKQNIDFICNRFEVSKRELQRALIFRPATSIFREKYQMSSDEILLFIQNEIGGRKEIMLTEYFGDLTK